MPDLGSKRGWGFRRTIPEKGDDTWNGVRQRRVLVSLDRTNRSVTHADPIGRLGLS